MNPWEWDDARRPGQVEQVGSLSDLLGRGVERFAGQAMPGGAGQLRDALITGQLGLEDDSGRVELGVTGPGSIRLQPKQSSWGLEASFGSSPSIQVRYDSRAGRPQQGVVVDESSELAAPSAGRALAEEWVNDYRARQPDWHRP
jgi:hypothetical protein